jgi:hypothetical protein
MIIGVLLAARPRRNTRGGDGRLRFPPSDCPPIPANAAHKEPIHIPTPDHAMTADHSSHSDPSTVPPDTGAEIDTMKPTEIASLRAQTVTG